MKIMQCAPFFPPSIGGTEVAVLGLSKSLVAKGHKVTVATFDAIGSDRRAFLVWSGLGLPKMEEKDGIHVRRFKTFCFGHHGLKIAPLMYPFLASSDAEIIHIHSFGHYANVILCAFAGKIARKKVVLTNHGFHETLEVLGRSPFGRAMIRILSKTLYYVDHIIALSTSSAETLKSLGVTASKISYIPNGIDKRLLDSGNGPDTRKDPQILSVSRMAPGKGIEVFIRAAKILVTRYPDLRFVQVGPCVDMSYRASLVKMVEDLSLQQKFVFMDRLSDKELQSAYKSSAVFVLPSLLETLPLVILEAMAIGIPCVATKVGGIPDIIQHGKNGLLVHPGDHNELAQAISLLFDDNELRSRIANNALATSKKMTWDSVTSEVIDVYLQRDDIHSHSSHVLL